VRRKWVGPRITLQPGINFHRLGREVVQQSALALVRLTSFSDLSCAGDLNHQPVVNWLIYVNMYMYVSSTYTYIYMYIIVYI
jgi:hypothetical protein